jgi:hypothetical protein
MPVLKAKKEVTHLDPTSLPIPSGSSQVYRAAKNTWDRLSDVFVAVDYYVVVVGEGVHVERLVGTAKGSRLYKGDKKGLVIQPADGSAKRAIAHAAIEVVWYVPMGYRWPE